MIESACAALREPPVGAVVVVVGPAFVVVRDGDAVLAYELAVSAPWHKSGVTLDELERLLGRVLWRTPVPALCEVDTEQGVIVIVSALATARLEMLERTAALICGRLDEGVSTHAKLLALTPGAAAVAGAILVDGGVTRL